MFCTFAGCFGHALEALQLRGGFQLGSPRPSLGHEAARAVGPVPAAGSFWSRAAVGGSFRAGSELPPGPWLRSARAGPTEPTEPDRVGPSAPTLRERWALCSSRQASPCLGCHPVPAPLPVLRTTRRPGTDLHPKLVQWEPAGGTVAGSTGGRDLRGRKSEAVESRVPPSGEHPKRKDGRWVRPGLRPARLDCAGERGGAFPSLLEHVLGAFSSFLGARTGFWVQSWGWGQCGGSLRRAGLGAAEQAVLETGCGEGVWGTGAEAPGQSCCWALRAEGRGDPRSPLHAPRPGPSRITPFLPQDPSGGGSGTVLSTGFYQKTDTQLAHLSSGEAQS